MSSDSSTSLRVAWISAGAVVLAAVIGLFTGTVEVPVLSGSPTSDDLQQQVADLEASNRSLEAKNEALVENSVAAPDGEITINNYTCIDLDSEEADWGVNKDGDGDLCYSDYLIGDRISELDEVPTYDTCNGQTQISESLRDVEKLLDRYVCVTSDAGRLVSLHVTAASPEAMSFEITKLDS